MSGGIGGEFLQILKGIDWNSLTAKDAVDLRAALKEAVAKSDEWFLKLTQDFGGMPAQLERVKSPQPEPAKVEVGRPPAQASHPREPKPTVRVNSPGKRKRGRPPKARPAPIALGGANAEGTDAPQPAKLFENSYISKDGPRVDIPATLPADHPRLNMHRESSVTPEQDAEDFHTVERAMQTGRGVKDIFGVR